ncbi:uncharacterized protein [Choristoneura fumiferana]|uniref:uncharacterized protein n=1 Tax=Choristoneura fumiferana TaxID=7141 RepID=UPI003D157336
MASSFNVQIKMENLCRTCLSKETILHSVFDVYSESIKFDYVLNAVTGLKIERDDGLPSKICQDCKERAINAFNYRTKSHEAHAALLLLYKKENSEILADGVKVENSVADDNDDGLEIDFSLSASPENYKDWSNNDTIKNESEVDGNRPCQQCKNCYLEFKSVAKLEEHLQKKCVKVECEDEHGTYCPLCGTCHENADNLTKHMWTNHAELMGPKKRGRPKKLLTSTILSKLSENGYHMKVDPNKAKSCLFCKDEFKTKLELGIHMMEHKGTKMLCCVLCKKMYLNILHFEQHICNGTNYSNKMLTQDTTLSIETRSKQIGYLTEVLLRDLLDPNGDMENINVPEVCSICSEVFLSEEDLVTHNDAEHPELSQRCNLCSKVFATLKSAARHRNICKQIERKFICSTCGLKFAYEISLNKHILRFHEGQSVSVKFMDPKTKLDERQYQCDTCNRCFYRKDLLARHTKQHMPSEKLFECDVCKKKFHRRDNLRSHKRVHEIHRDKSASNNCLCLYCGRSFSNSSNLIVHMRRHTGEKPYKCDFCGKGFPRSSDLQCHRRSHTGEKPCICVVCGKGFSRSNKLSRHMRVHTGHKPYKCTYCEKAFSQSNDLTLHIRRHTGDKPYICEICGDRFIQGTSLHNHRRAHGHFPASSSDTHSNVQGLSYTSITPHS